MEVYCSSLPEHHRRINRAPMKVSMFFFLLLHVFLGSSVSASDVEMNSQSMIDSQAFSIFLSPFGDDSNTGLILTQPVLSLDRAQEILRDYQPQRAINIYINSGTYYYQQVKWTYTNGHLITFRPLRLTAERPVFDGLFASDTWFSLNKSGGVETKLKFLRLKIQNYKVGMSFNGNREKPDRWNGGNELNGMYFYRIGGRYYSADHSTAAVRLVNSRNNKITNTHFVDILNQKNNAHLIHPVYLAHHSINNVIEKSRFVRSNGNPIAVRDSSNNNIIRENRFYSTGDTAIYQEWFCQKDQDRCTKQKVECPSTGNLFLLNEVYGGYQNQVRTFKLRSNNNACGALEDKRLRTALNVQK